MAKQIEQSCRTCKYLEPDRDKNGRPMVRKGNLYNCTFPLPEVQLPDSVTTAYGYNAWRKTRCAPDRGNECPTWTAKDAG